MILKPGNDFSNQSEFYEKEIPIDSLCLYSEKILNRS